MRAILVLLALVVVAWGVFVFRPTGEVEGGESAAEAPPGPFLTRPERSPATEESPLPAPRPAAADRDEPVPEARDQQPAPEPPAEDRAAFGISLDVPSGDIDDRVLAEALLFEGPGGVEQALGRINESDDATRRLYLSFSEALAGNRRAGLKLAQGLDDPDVLGAADREMLQAALSGQAGPAARPASFREESSVRAAMRLRLLEREANRLLDSADYAGAAAGFSELLLSAVKGPWEPTRAALLAWTDGVNRSQAQHRWSPRGDWPGVDVTVRDGDNLTLIRKRYLADHPNGMICTGLIARANGVEGYLHENQQLRIPTDRASALVDLSSRWVFYLLGGEVAAAWEAGIGRDGEETILGDFVAADKQERPTWFKRGQEPRYFPDNPLGTRWIAWYRDGAKTGFGFHGTWEEESIGKAASDGCVRLRNDDVEVLFAILPAGAAIHTQM
ncbi:MAG: L,D-transpeptidase [Planctomycetota bacterium]